MGPLRSVWSALKVGLAVGFVVTVGIGAGVVASVKETVPEIGDLSNYRPPEATKIYSRDGVLLAKVYRENREYVPLEKIPDELKWATVAIEDERFYRHKGLDPEGIARALWRNLKARRIVEGGSTITQQLARVLFLTRKRTIGRKLQEAFLAVELERRLSKDEILELYLNTVYYGRGAYGVQAAALTYFGKPVWKLNLAECALIAAIPKAPSRYNPIDNPEAARRRRNLVLDKMAELGYITYERAEEAKREPLKVRKPPAAGYRSWRAPYFVRYVLKWLMRKFGPEVVYKGGLRVYTTLDYRLQRIAWRAVKWGIKRLKRRRADEGALVALNPYTGEILALVGGVDFLRNQYCCATQARRQPGSAFKPIVYATALEMGDTPASIVEDSPVTYKGARGRPWRPRNYDGKHRGKITYQTALELSINVAAVKVCAKVGPERVIRMARRLGIRSPLDPYLPIALGSEEVTLLELASAYEAFLNQGRRAEPACVLRVEDSEGRTLYKFHPEVEQVLSPKTAEGMRQMLVGVILRGTGRRARLPWPAAGKTGTTSNYTDAWFIGFSRELLAGVWVGRRDHKPMWRVVGGFGAAPIWRRFMLEAVPIVRGYVKPPPGITFPTAKPSGPPKEEVERSEEGTIRVVICEDSGLLATPYCPHKVEREFPRGKEPREKCNLHRPSMVEVTVCAETGLLATPHCPKVVKVVSEDRVPTKFCPKHGGEGEESPEPVDALAGE